MSLVAAGKGETVDIVLIVLSGRRHDERDKLARSHGQHLTDAQGSKELGIRKRLPMV